MAAGGAVKLLHLGKYYPPEPGGIEYVVKILMEATSSGFANHAIVADKGRRHWEETGPAATIYHRKAVGTLFLTPVLPGLFSFLHALRKRNRFDCIVLHVPNPMTTLALAASDLVSPLREKLVIFYHADILLDSPLHRLAYFLFRPIEARVFRKADRFVATSPNMARLSPTLKRHSGKVSVIPLMIPDEWQDATAEEERQAETIRRTAGGPIVLFVGRLIPYKGLDTLVKAVPHVPRAKFLLVGDGPLEEALRREAAARGVADRMVFVGRAANLKPYYLACDLFVLPSDSPLEAFGLVQLEAMSFGKPVVSSDLPTGVTYVNRNGKTGLTFPVRDAETLGKALNRLLSDESLRSRLGACARERVRKRFLSSVVGARFAQMVLALAGSPARK